MVSVSYFSLMCHHDMLFINYVLWLLVSQFYGEIIDRHPKVKLSVGNAMHGTILLVI